jgi:3-deoxy-D-manno-octulosonic acid kinase
VRLPQGYARATVGATRIVADGAALERVCAAVAQGGTLYGWAKAAPGAASLAGRSPAYRVDAAGDEWVVRHYWRGGAIGPLLDDRYPAGRLPRPFRELLVSHEARERGVPTPRVVAAVVYPARAFYRGDLATAYVPDSADLADVTFGPVRLPLAERAAAWRAAGVLVRVAAERGLRHPDLNLRNVLLYGPAEAPLACVLDLDRARLEDGALRPVDREAMVGRLHRSRRKLERTHGERLDDRSLWSFAEGLRG